MESLRKSHTHFRVPLNLKLSHLKVFNEARPKIIDELISEFHQLRAGSMLEIPFPFENYYYCCCSVLFPGTQGL